MSIVLKAERVSNESLEKGYVFPDKDDNLTSYTGGSAQLAIPGDLLQDICKFKFSNDMLFTCGHVCYIKITVICSSLLQNFVNSLY